VTTRTPQGINNVKRDAKVLADQIVVARGDTVEGVLFKGTRAEMSRRDLHVALEPIIRRWIRAACSWDDLAIGDYRFVIFALDIAPETQLYVQFWSEPGEDVVWEVSSGKWNPPADEWLEGERAQRIQALGFAIGGKAENYHRVVSVKNAADVAAIAKTVVRIFYDGFEYRGQAPILASLTYEGRSEPHLTFDSFTPDDVRKVLTSLGFRVDDPSGSASEDDAAVVSVSLRCRKRGTTTLVELGNRAEGENLFSAMKLSADVKPTSEQLPELVADDPGALDSEPVLSISTVLAFSGGVTLGWFIERIRAWEAVLAEHRRAHRQASKRVVPVGTTAIH
jgi:hypothetical protein